MLSLQRPRVLIVAALAMWAVFAVAAAWLQPLGHDEARYAISARDFLEGTPMRWVYVPRGMLYLSAPGVAIGGSVFDLRIVPIILGFFFLFASWRFALDIFSASTAAWLLVILASSSAFAKRAGELLSDLPSSACLLLGILMLLQECSREDGPRWRLSLVAPLFAASFYIRYGTLVPILAISVTTLTCFYRAVLRRSAPVIACIVAFLLLLVPHILFALETTGSVAGVMLESLCRAS